MFRARLHDPSLAKRSPTGLHVIKTHWEQTYVPYRPEAKEAELSTSPLGGGCIEYNKTKAYSAAAVHPCSPAKSAVT
jgi:hypothetical protein